MPVTFGPEGLVVQKSVAADALTQLNQMSVFAKASMGSYEDGAFEIGNTVTFRRVRISEAEEYDPRGGGTANETEPGYVTGDLTLEKLFTNAIPVYSSDYQIEKYLAETGPQIALSITKAFDNYLYGKFRTPTHPSVGNVAYGVNMPIRIVANHASGAFTTFDQSLLIDAGGALEEEDVPPGTLFGIISTQAKSNYLGTQTPVDAGAVYAQAGVSGLLQNGMPQGRFVERMGFMLGSSNVIGRNGTQAGVLDLDTAAGSQASLPIAAVAANTAFTKADFVASQSLGAIDFTLTATGLQNVAVGQIAQIGADGATAKAFGVVLRVDVANKIVTLVPFDQSGHQLATTDINTASDKFAIPKISSVSVAYHQEALIHTERQMKPPSENSGAQAVTSMDEMSGLALQIWTGGYQINRFKESQRYSLLTGAKLTDYRKAVLMLSF